MSFDAAWLALREPADRAARDPGLRTAALAHLGEVAAPLAIDLGCGTGSLARDFAADSPDGLRWRLVDSDPELLAIAAASYAGAETVAADLADLDDLPLAGARLVTASALLDLASADWLDGLAARLALAGVGLYARLSYDGAMVWTPPRPEDADVVAAFNAHQRRDKGLGPALGPGAAAHMAAALAERDFVVWTATSPWRLGSVDAALIAELADGVARAASETGCLGTGAWAQARRAARGCTVGHVDLLALPAAVSRQSKTTSESSP
jgi:SAM-dependent methyltransferase